MSAAQPLFSLGDQFDATVPIGDVALPIHVKRFSRAEIDDFEKKWAAHMLDPRGSAERTPEELAQRDAERLAFCEAAIRDYVTIDDGLLLDRGKSVTDGAGLIAMFYARKDVLSTILAAIYVQNRLGGVIRKNSNSPRATDAGSSPIQPRGEAKSDSTAGSAGSSGTATPLAATDANAGAEDEPASSGESDAPTKVH
jgi:hypothetical protein